MSICYTLLPFLVASTAFAHCQLAWPYPLHSALNPATPEPLMDYSMTSPLIADGTYPCKGFINKPASAMGAVDTYSAGSSINYTIAGTATHGGGSCQISMSYDLGATWSVIFSYVGGCLIEGLTTSLTIPTDAPSGEALFSWSWFNLLGNREMYQNCAVVTITDGGNGLSAESYPAPFVANAGVNECVTIEGTAVVFPNPGINVRYGGTYANTKPTTPAGFTGTNCVGPEAGSMPLNSISSPISETSSASTVVKTSPSTSASSTTFVGKTPSPSPPPTVSALPSSSSSLSSAPPARTTLWTVSGTSISTVLSVLDVDSSSSLTHMSAEVTACTRKRKRSGQPRSERRHGRLVQRRAMVKKSKPASTQETGSVRV